MWKAASQPCTPALIASLEERSPSTSVALIRSSFAPFSRERTSATTSSPRSRSRLTSFSPMKPVPPVTKAFTAGDSRRSLPRLECMERGRNGRTGESKQGEGIRNPRARQRALLIAAAPDEPDLAELRELLRTAGVAVAGEMAQRRARPDPDRYFGRGKLTELKRAIGESAAN